MKKSDHRCLCCLVVVVFGFCLSKIGDLEYTSNSTAEPVRFQINLNSASVEELILLPGIGEVRAASIVKYRHEMGPFQSVDELRRIKGIGPKTLSGLRKLVFVHPPSTGISQRSIATSQFTDGHERSIAAVPEDLE